MNNIEKQTPNSLTEGTGDFRTFARVAGELSEATRKAYDIQLRLTKKFYAEQEWELYNPNPTVFVKQFLTYMNHLAEQGRTPSTITKAISALRWEAGYLQPTYSGLLSARPIKAFLAGVAREQKGRTVRKAKAFTITELRTLYKALRRTARNGNLLAVRDKAIIALGIGTALRASNLGMLTIGDITKTHSVEGLLVQVRYSKTDQTGEGQTIPVLRHKDRLIDPVRAVEDWVEVLRVFGHTQPETPLFPRIRGKRGITADPIKNPNLAISHLLHTWTSVADIPVEGFTSHSLRATFITLSSQAGVPETAIAAVSGHQSMKTLRSYDRSSVERFGQTDYLNN